MLLYGDSFLVERSRYGNWLRSGLLRNRDLVPSRKRDCSLHHSVQAGSGAQLAFYTMGIVSCFSGGKAAEAGSSPLTSI
jgi:hypothetical protein